MTAIAASIERHHRLTIALLSLIMVMMLISCTVHDAIPICRWLFGCAHQMHAGRAFAS